MTKETINEIHEWIQIIEMPELKKEGMKTDIFLVRSTIHDVNLGWIKWIPSWRKYGFYPEADTFYEEVCLEHINDFLKRLKEKRK